MTSNYSELNVEDPGICGVCGLQGALNEIEHDFMTEHMDRQEKNSAEDSTINNVNNSDIVTNDEVAGSSTDSIRWSTAHVLLLIRLVENNYNLFSSMLKKNVWVKISQEMKKTIGTLLYTPEQIENKWKGLKKTYKKIKDQKNTTGEKAVKWQFFNWQFFNAMNDLLGKKTEISPPAVCSTTEGLMVSESVNQKAAGEIVNGDSGSKPIFLKKRKCVENKVSRRHKEKMLRYDRFLDLYEKFVSNTGQKSE